MPEVKPLNVEDAAPVDEVFAFVDFLPILIVMVELGFALAMFNFVLPVLGTSMSGASETVSG